MLISARQAAAELAAVGISRRHARRLIASGAAGTVTRNADPLAYPLAYPLAARKAFARCGTRPYA